jgi:hypothetical protein
VVRVHAPPFSFHIIKGALKKQLLRLDPAVDGEPPKRTHNDRHRMKAVVTLEQAAAFVAAARGSTWGRYLCRSW